MDEEKSFEPKDSDSSIKSGDKCCCSKLVDKIDYRHKINLKTLSFVDEELQL